MIAEKMIRYMSVDNIQIGILHYPAFATLQAQHDYDNTLWADEKIRFMFLAAHHVLIFEKKHKDFEMHELQWVLVEAALLGIGLLYSPGQKLILPLVMRKCLVKEIADILHKDDNTISTQITRMSDKAGIYEKTSAAKLRLYFWNKIHDNVA
jgi:hypothetical protein